MMRLYFVFTSLFRICFLAVMLCFSSSAFAAITLRLEDGVSLQFSSGDFDIQRYTGEMRDVVLFQDDQIVAEADFVKMQTSGEFETASFVINDLVVENLQLYPTDGSELIVKSITAQDLPLGLIAGAPGTADDLAGMNWDQAFFKIDEMLYLDAPAGFGAEIASIGLRDIGILQLAAGTSLLEKIRLEMPMMRIVPLGRSPAATEFETWLSRLGRDDLTIQLNTQTNMREQAGILRQITGFELALSGLGEIYFDIEIQNTPIGRLVFHLTNPSPLPLHAENIIQLVKGSRRSIDPKAHYVNCEFDFSPASVEDGMGRYKWGHQLRGRGRNAIGRADEPIVDIPNQLKHSHSIFGGQYYGDEWFYSNDPDVLLTVPILGPGHGTSKFSIIRVGESPKEWRERLLINAGVIGRMDPSSLEVLHMMARQRVAPPKVVEAGVLTSVDD